MQFCFIKDRISLIMPITPSNYKWSRGKNMETINISQIGDVYLPGGQTKFEGGFDFMLPAQNYPFLEAGAYADPQYYLDYLEAWALSGAPVRLVITETSINALVYIEEVTQSEHDGTGDRYITVYVKEYTNLEAVAMETTKKGTQNRGRARDTSSAIGKTQSYTIKRGDTLSAICRTYYGKSTAQYYNALARYNSIKNPHLIYAGNTIKIPPESILFGGSSK